MKSILLMAISSFSISAFATSPVGFSCKVTGEKKCSDGTVLNYTRHRLSAEYDSATKSWSTEFYSQPSCVVACNGEPICMVKLRPDSKDGLTILTSGSIERFDDKDGRPALVGDRDTDTYYYLSDVYKKSVKFENCQQY